MDIIDTVPVVVRILIVFSLILLAIKRKWMLGNAFLAGAAALGLIFGMRPIALAHAALAASLHPKTLSLSVVVGLILVLSHSLEKSGQMARLLENFKGLLLRSSVNLVIFPALIGLLPMPGGAIFSAPMVKNIGGQQQLAGSHLSFVNYWFRHIWEYWWPLYPGVLLATTLAEINLWKLVLCTMPLTFVAVTVGYWPLRHILSIKDNVGFSWQSRRRALRTFFKELQPIAFVIIGGLGLGLLFSYALPIWAAPLAKEIGLILALLIAIVWVWRTNGMPWDRRLGILQQPGLFKMLYMVSAILAFKGVLEQSGAVQQLSQDMLRWNIPLVTITIVLPMLVGGIAGITIAFVGATFPILVSLIQAMQQTHLMLPYIMLAMASGFVGVLISPLHLCFLLSNEYFDTSLLPVYHHMRVPLIAMLTAAVVYFGGLYYWLG